MKINPEDYIKSARVISWPVSQICISCENGVLLNDESLAAQTYCCLYDTAKTDGIRCTGYMHKDCKHCPNHASESCPNECQGPEVEEKPQPEIRDAFPLPKFSEPTEPEAIGMIRALGEAVPEFKQQVGKMIAQMIWQTDNPDASIEQCDYCGKKSFECIGEGIGLGTDTHYPLGKCLNENCPSHQEDFICAGYSNGYNACAQCKFLPACELGQHNKQMNKEANLKLEQTLSDLDGSVDSDLTGTKDC